MAGGGRDNMKKGEALVLAGLFVQIVAFVFFGVIAIRFDFIMRKRDRVRGEKTGGLWVDRGNSGYLMAHEVFLYVFDSVLMLFLMLMFNVAHPGWLLPVGETPESGSPMDSEQATVDGDMEMGERSRA